MAFDHFRGSGSVFPITSWLLIITSWRLITNSWLVNKNSLTSKIDCSNVGDSMGGWGLFIVEDSSKRNFKARAAEP